MAFAISSTVTISITIAMSTIRSSRSATRRTRSRAPWASTSASTAPPREQRPRPRPEGPSTMRARALAFVRCLGALLLLLACTWAVEIPALAFLWRGQSLPPYAFFPNQTYDFLAKIRWFGDAVLSWAPALPDRFVGPGFAIKLTSLGALLPATLVTAFAVGCAVALPNHDTVRQDYSAATQVVRGGLPELMLELLLPPEPLPQICI